MYTAFKSTVHTTPVLNTLRCKIRHDYVINLARLVQRIQIFIHMIRHKTPQRESLLSQFQVYSILLTIPNERSKLRAHYMIVKDEHEAFIEFKCIDTLLHNLPDTVEELCKNGRDLKGDMELFMEIYSQEHQNCPSWNRQVAIFVHFWSTSSAFCNVFF